MPAAASRWATAPVDPTTYNGGVVYRTMTGGRLLLGGIFVVFGVAAVGLIIATVAGGDDAPAVPFALLWIAIMLWNAYWWLYRIAIELRVQGDELTVVTVVTVVRPDASCFVTSRRSDEDASCGT